MCPQPENFPATFADFLRLMVGEDPANAEEKLRAYVHDTAEKFLAQPRFALAPEQLRQAAESWTAAKLEKFRQGFTRSDGWQSAARAFKAWTETAPATP